MRSPADGARGGKDEIVQWGYEGPGAPQNWASLSEEYRTCADGKQQSPIDIRRYLEGRPASISFSYRVATKAVRNDGRFVHVDYQPGNTLSVGHQTYQLETAHIHSPSEHLIQGRRFAAELHLVHSDAAGHVVVAQLFHLGAHNPLVQAVLDVAPRDEGAVVDGSTLNAYSFVSSGSGYYRYDGSTTTPPCDEPVGWYVMRQPTTICGEQVDGLLELSGGPNSRPVQPLGNRLVIVAG